MIHVSGRPAGTRHGSQWLRRALIESARATARTKNSYYSAQYARIARRRGANKAAAAVANSMLFTIWHLLSTGALYDDPGADYFVRRHDPAVEAKRLARRIEALGFDVSLIEKAVVPQQATTSIFHPDSTLPARAQAGVMGRHFPLESWAPRARKEISALAATDQSLAITVAPRVGGEIIRTLQLTKVYPGTDFAAVDRLDLTVHPREIFGLLGPNGAGKTTTAGMLTTRVVPTSGQALVAGVDVIAHPARAKQLIGVVSQQNTLDRSLTVWENLYFHGLLFGVPKREARRVTDELLEQFVLSKWAKATVHALSGGMAQRLMVARAIFHRPAVLFMDEPTAGLDPQSRLALWEILGKLNQQGQTILLTTHYMEEADQLCDRVAIMDHGQILALDTPANLKQSIDADTVLTVRTSSRTEELAKLLKSQVEGAVRTRLIDGGVELFVRNPGHGLLPRVVNVAEDAGIVVNDLSVSETTLETVFISLTGKELRD